MGIFVICLLFRHGFPSTAIGFNSYKIVYQSTMMIFLFCRVVLYGFIIICEFFYLGENYWFFSSTFSSQLRVLSINIKFWISRRCSYVWSVVPFLMVSRQLQLTLAKRKWVSVDTNGICNLLMFRGYYFQRCVVLSSLKSLAENSVVECL